MRRMQMILSFWEIPDKTLTNSNFLAPSKRMGLCIYEEKTKFTMLYRKKENQPNIQVDNLIFEKEESFKFLGVSINGRCASGIS